MALPGQNWNAWRAAIYPAGGVYRRPAWRCAGRQALKLADLFVLPGTGGLAVQQAMAYGLPVIVAQGDGTQDDLVRPGNGWQVPPDDLPALQACLEAALADPARLRQMGAESYRIVRDEINVEQMVAVFVRR